MESARFRSSAGCSPKKSRRSVADTKEAFADVRASALSELHDFHGEVQSKVVHDWLPVQAADCCSIRESNENNFVDAEAILKVSTGSYARPSGVSNPRPAPILEEYSGQATDRCSLLCFGPDARTRD